MCLVGHGCGPRSIDFTARGARCLVVRRTYRLIAGCLVSGVISSEVTISGTLYSTTRRAREMSGAWPRRAVARRGWGREEREQQQQQQQGVRMCRPHTFAEAELLCANGGGFVGTGIGILLIEAASISTGRAVWSESAAGRRPESAAGRESAAGHTAPLNEQVAASFCGGPLFVYTPPPSRPRPPPSLG